MRLSIVVSVLLSLSPTAAWSAEGKPPIIDGLTTHRDVDTYVACVTQGYAKQWPGTHAATYPSGRQILIAPDDQANALAEMSVANRNGGESLVTLRASGLSLRTQRDMAGVMKQCR
ncbi:hypothetical protein [Luteibacter aegosomatissinici]|uniref:hypothetical protein n=1 Tax=Luteibacter aegosomatissinici TaxID=2911539 RepID=UPI001FF82513|nr:hypothetical protein [Luteibacter aegosomatissinici]UPG94315.1 hypothetical protein L2Y97_21280 [Luteibacter aegosomatissinici]